MPSAPEGQTAASPRANATTEGPIVFFDGVCGLCNRFVDTLLKADVSQRLRFAPLQGSTARERIPIGYRQSLGTVVLVDERGVSERSEAVLRILEHLGGKGVPWARLLRRVPLGLRDWVYTAIATRRYRWFGQRDTCRMPTPLERERFLP